MTTAGLAGRGRRGRRIRKVERIIHAASMTLLDLTPSDRRSVVEGMFRRRRRDNVGYWLQLVLSMAIATLGLVTSSTAVVIGAMLIAPLMGPVVELGMGLVVGSPVLTIRSAVRLAASLVLVVGGAAVLTLLLPFHETTPEIAARTAPTALDLLLAVFVAVAAAFTTARPGADTASAAAGTAIGIALVPPVCVAGFGLGIGSRAIAGGATLLFVTNLTAILVVSVLFFWLLGFERVRYQTWEAEELGSSRSGVFVLRAVAATRRVFGARYGRALRVGLPVVLVGLVVFPLNRGLRQVAWEVRARSAVGRIVAHALGSRSAVQTQVSVSAGAISAELYVIGTAEEAARIEDEVRTGVAAATSVVPVVRVTAVPDAAALLRTTTAPAEGAPRVLDWPELRDRLAGALAAEWPQAELGPVLEWRFELPDSTTPRLLIDHYGDPVGPAAQALLGHALSVQTGRELAVATHAYPTRPIDTPTAQAWLDSLAGVIGEVRAHDRLRACVAVPTPTSIARGSAAARRLAQTRSLVSGVAGVEVDSAGETWSLRYSPGPCAPPAGDSVPRR